MHDTTPDDTGHDRVSSEAVVILRDYRRSLDVMEAALRSADPDRWDAPSPCEHWSARQVAGHAMTFVRNVVALAGDGPAPDFHADVDFAAVAGHDPVVTWTATRQLIEDELLTRPERLDAIRLTPLGLEMPMIALLTFQGMDPVVHGWDVAIATGGTVEIADDLAEQYIERFTPFAEPLRAGGLLGPARVGGGTPADRLLDLCGRIR